MKNDQSIYEGPWRKNAEGPKSGGPSGGGPSSPPIFNAPAIVIWTIGFLVAAFVLLAVLPGRFVKEFEWVAGVVPLRFLAGPNASGGILGMLAPLFSHMALHANLMHIFFNSIWLLAFGAPVARRLGAGQVGAGILPSSLFISFLALSGAAGALFYVALNMKDTVLLVGASGGVSGLLGAVLRIMLRRPAHFTKDANTLAPLTDRNLLIWSALILILNFFSAVYGSIFTPGGPDIAWEAHMGGFLFGLLTFPLFDRLARRA